MNNEPTKRLKVDEVEGVKKQKQALVVQLTQNREATIELDNYSENAIEEFRDLLQHMANYNGKKIEFSSNSICPSCELYFSYNNKIGCKIK